MRRFLPRMDPSEQLVEPTEVTEAQRRASQGVRRLRWALISFGIVMIVGVYPLMLGWQAGWRWKPHQDEYEQMIVAIYVVLGVFLIWAARNPLRHLSLIWFAVWSSLAHAVVMLVQSFADSSERGHLVGDVPTLLVVAGVLTWLTPRQRSAAS